MREIVLLDAGGVRGHHTELSTGVTHGVPGTPYPSNKLPRGVARRSKSQRGPEFRADSEPVLVGEMPRNIVHRRPRHGHKEASKQ